jgi:phenylacetic acid degradation operon negative regulatory protein
LVRTEGDLESALRRLLRRRSLRAKSLVVTVLGDTVAPHGGSVWIGTLIRWLSLFGVNERAVRTAMHRLVSEGWVENRSRGRRSEYRITDSSRHRFAEAEQRIYAAGPPAWDGRWCLVLLGAEGIGRRSREAARRELHWHGFGELAPTVLVHPAADFEAVRLALAELGLGGRAIVLRAEAAMETSPGSLARLVARAWDLRDLAGEYREFVQAFGPLAQLLEAGVRPSPEQAFVLRVLAIHEYRRVLLRDPQLPGELLPARWEGAEARRLCAAIYRRIEPDAAGYVVETGETLAGPLPPPAEGYFTRFGGLRRATGRQRR